MCSLPSEYIFPAHSESLRSDCDNVDSNQQEAGPDGDRTAPEDLKKILKKDKAMPKKQRHTAKLIFERLRGESELHHC